jgi:hypothetical protein
MDYRTIVDVKRKMDFNLTEHETLVKLVDDAQKKGTNAQKEMVRLGNNAAKLLSPIQKLPFLLGDSDLKGVGPKTKCAVGIDGSFQTVGGIGGIWYAPISVAMIVFPNGAQSKAQVRIFSAGIEQIKEQEEHNPNRAASIFMLSGETKAIEYWAVNGTPAYVLIDGPIVDPPGYPEEGYVKDRCNAIRKCLRTNYMVGCVKRSRDNFFIEYLKHQKGIGAATIQDFPSDQHLMLFLFTAFRRSGHSGPIFTKWMNVSDDQAYKAYSKNGIHVVSLYFQKSTNSQALRLDIPFAKNPADDETERAVLHIVRTASDWTYPGHDYPLPIFLAHQKCNIREGCAEVLYDEILTRTTTSDPSSQTVQMLLR